MKFPKEILGQIQEHLLTEKKRIGSMLSSLKSQDPYSDPDRLNDNAASDTDAKEESSHERMEALAKELKINLEEIDQALIRIKSATYGRCKSCNNMIDTDRLAIKPTALYCVDCVKKKENK